MALTSAIVYIVLALLKVTACIAICIIRSNERIKKTEINNDTLEQLVQMAFIHGKDVKAGTPEGFNFYSKNPDIIVYNESLDDEFFSNINNFTFKS